MNEKTASQYEKLEEELTELYEEQDRIALDKASFEAEYGEFASTKAQYRLMVASEGELRTRIYQICKELEEMDEGWD